MNPDQDVSTIPDDDLVSRYQTVQRLYKQDMAQTPNAPHVESMNERRIELWQEIDRRGLEEEVV